MENEKDKYFDERSSSFFCVEKECEEALKKTGISSLEDVFAFKGGDNLVKENLVSYRSRIQFHTESPVKTLFMKRYDTTPKWIQFKNWLTHRKRASLGFFDHEPAMKLRQYGINTPKTASFGQKWGLVFEKRSFCISEKISDAESIERKLPGYFHDTETVKNLKLKRDFILRFARFIRKFHETGYRHRDLYFSHIFYDKNDEFYLIDLARAFVPIFSSKRFRIKDIAQLFYSSSGRFFSKTDRIRFYLEYRGKTKLYNKDKKFIRRVINKAWNMAVHDIKHGRGVPFNS